MAYETLTITMHGFYNLPRLYWGVLPDIFSWRPAPAADHILIYWIVFGFFLWRMKHHNFKNFRDLSTLKAFADTLVVYGVTAIAWDSMILFAQHANPLEFLVFDLTLPLGLCLRYMLKIPFNLKQIGLIFSVAVGLNFIWYLGLGFPETENCIFTYGGSVLHQLSQTCHFVPTKYLNNTLLNFWDNCTWLIPMGIFLGYERLFMRA